MKKICHPGALLICGAAGIYGTEPLTELVKLLKYSSMLSASEVLGDTLFEYAASLKIPIEDFIVMPIPLPKKRLRHRGFNQAELIARRFLSRTGYEKNFCLDMFERRFTKPQTEMKNYERRVKNVQNCFTIKDKNLIADKNIMGFI